MLRLPPPFVLRSPDGGDADFLVALFSDSRPDLHVPGMDPVALGQLIQMQYRVQQVGFSHHFPQAQSFLIGLDQRWVGRVVIDEGDTDLRLVDLAVLTAERRKGVASAILSSIQQSASERGKSVSLAVSKFNPGAIALYLSHGFSVSGEDEMFMQMVWGE
ncbi:MAG: GNAT family N-acetyltransferase [Ramlibacter sp.]|nr:GNAT family N-acetyltransferase [Ramlibacter sp.]